MVVEGFQAGGPAPTPATRAVSNTFFKCSESPIVLTKEQIDEIKRNQSAVDTFHVSALASGTETISVVSVGLNIAGTTVNTMRVNGSIQCTWLETRLVIPGAHQVVLRGSGDLVKGAAEMQIYFKNNNKATDIYCICIPVLEGSGIGKEFFATLGMPQRNRPSFTSLWTESTGFLQYTAKDLRNRTNAKCTEDDGKIRYLVAVEPAYIESSVLTRLKGNLTTANGYAGPPRAQMVSNKLSLISYISSIQIASTQKTRNVANGYVETSQVKCRPLDQRRDISGNLIYVGGKERRGDTSLDRELASAADMTGGFEEPTATVQGSDIETILGIVLGVVIGIVVVAFFVVWVFQKTTTNYTKVLEHYSSAGFEKASQVAKSVWAKIIPERCTKVVEKARAEERAKAAEPKP